MRHRIQMIAVTAGLAVVVGAGFAVAKGDQGPNYPGGEPDAGKPVGNPILKPSEESWIAYMNGKSEIDPEGAPGAGDPDATGVASFMQFGTDTLCYGFMLKGASTPTQVHIHKGKAGKNGPPVIEFTNLPKDANGQPAGDPGASSGCKALTDPAEADALARLAETPERYYANFHTDEYPDGAVRGQLGPIWFAKQKFGVTESPGAK